jgi:hypothetical protein
MRHGVAAAVLTGLAGLGPACSSSELGAGGDAGPACTGDHAEIDEGGNGDFGSPEDTGLVLGAGGEARICGRLGGGEDGDVDLFALEIERDLDLRVELQVPAGDRATDLELALYTGGGAAIGSARYRGGAAVAGASLAAGRYLVAARAAAIDGDPIAYNLVAGESAIDCAAVAGATASYTEADDGEGSRGNDVIAVSHGSLTEFTETAADDAPEPTELTLAAGDRITLAGLSAPALPDGDSYRDRDSFVVTLAGGTSELAASLEWSSSTDLDLYIFEKGGAAGWREMTGGLGTLRGLAHERLVISAAPTSELLVWVGQSLESPEKAAGYQIALCPRGLVR